ncbi:hypothetical protein M3Y98_00354000 [Aphelenchoides besseyi]|nr:hypothetical protein M3Y98_00354000 [Aphelenchoides besseyi]
MNAVNVLFSASSGQTETGSTTTLPPHIHESTSGHRPQSCGACQTVNSAMIGLVQKTFSIIAQSYTYIFLLGASAGAGFELFKINFSVNGVNYYTVFKDRQLKKELKKFEDDLKKHGRRNSNVCAATEGFSVFILGYFRYLWIQHILPLTRVYHSSRVVFLGNLF